MPNFVVTTKQVGAIMTALVVGIWAVFQFVVSPLHGDIQDVSARIDGLVDPVTGYPKVVQDAVSKGLADAMREDARVKLEVEAKVDVELKKLIEGNNAALRQIAAEINKSRETLTAAINSQTKQLSRDIGRLEGEMSNVRSTQNILLQRLGVEVPADPKSYWKNGLWKDAPYNLAPLWVIERSDYDLFQGDRKKVFYRIEAVKGLPE